MLKRSLLLLTTWLLLLQAPVRAQQQSPPTGLNTYFNEAYQQYPNIPRGMLEALAYSASHMNNLQSHEGSDHASCAGIPEQFGLFGLIENGQGYFKNNLIDVIKVSNITAAQYRKDVRLQILAVAKFLSLEASALRVSAGASVESFSGVLEKLTEIPNDGSNVNQYARSLFTYAVYDHMQRGFEESGVKAAPIKVQMEKIFPEKTLRTMRAPKVVIDYDNDRIDTESGSNGPAADASASRVVTTAAVGITAAATTDYSAALWKAAHANNYGVGRSVAKPTNVTIHTAQGTYTGTISWFQNGNQIVNGTRVYTSAHYVIRTSDGQVTQMVREANRAFHVRDHNYYTVGIEHEGRVEVASSYSKAMYASSAALVRDICTRQGISKSATFPGPATSVVNFQPITVRVKGHQHYNGNNHTDPGIYWDWKGYAALINPTTTPPTPTVVTKMNFTVKNESTGAAIGTATVVAKSASGTTTTLTTDASGKATFNAPAAGKYTFTITKSGYKTIETFFTAAAATTTLTAGINLDANTTGRTDNTAGKIAANSMAINGYITDADAGAPVAGVQVTAGKYSGVTDNTGFFSITFPAPVKAVTQNVIPETISIVASKKGYISHTVKNFYLIPETYTLKIGLIAETSAQGARKADDVEVQQHGMLDRKEGDRQVDDVDPSKILSARVAETPVSLVEAAAISIPTTIRVGLNCSACTTCTSVEVMSLESYVGSGVDNEWYASWNANSLQAASVAYRTYGAWYILNPVTTNYDIASSTCNQVWGSGFAASVKTATAVTKGLVLTKGGAIFRAEYSAESNNSGCGDGFSGTGTTSGWPCISDERCKGKTKNGHGRGMCQWGSNYWGTDKSYNWILEHYYNPGGVYVGEPVTTIYLTAKNMSTAAIIANATVTLTTPGGAVNTYKTDATGKVTMGVYAGKSNVSVAASGYKSLTTFFTGGAHTNVVVDFNLDPTTTLAARTTGKSTATTNSVVVNGYVRDNASGAALAGAQVTAGMYSGTTDHEGYFSFSIPASAAALTQGKVPEAVTIRSAKAGYTAYSIKNFRLIPDTYTFQISLSAGTGENGRTIQQPEMEEVSRHGMFDRTAADEQMDNSDAREVTNTAAALAAVTVPGAIRVSTNCACATCLAPEIQVMSLESYVATGVDNEWYSSWAAPSLQAAAVAYRSRGAWYVNNPTSRNYDISSAACHQTWSREMSASVKAATTATTGVVLVQNGVIVKADYAAETNNTGCGNGFSGTSATWPCISDERCKGRESKGLGKGMCQWGSSFWASDKTYTWILDHYYAPAGIAIQTASGTLVNAKEGDHSVVAKEPVARLLVSPNPVSGNTVRVTYLMNQKPQNAFITISAMSGRPVSQERVALQAGVNQFSLNIKSLQAGSYIVTIRLATGNTTESKQLVVVR
jgi:peptidoglycan hydrolase-like amidase/N-acetyl-anhydromuramyl-L-alanine amidase AmpD